MKKITDWAGDSLEVLPASSFRIAAYILTRSDDGKPSEYSTSVHLTPEQARKVAKRLRKLADEHEARQK